MRRLAGLALLFVTACAPLTPPPPPPAAPPPAVGDAVSRGRALVEARCSGCHAVGATGDSPLVPAPPFRTLSRRYPVAHLQEAFAEGISTGHPQMPQIQLEADQVGDLIAYLESIQSTDRRP